MNQNIKWPSIIIASSLWGFSTYSMVENARDSHNKIVAEIFC
jgi:hypothetical protein